MSDDENQAGGPSRKRCGSALHLAPRKKAGQPLILPLSRNIKSDREFNHDVTGRLLCPAGLDWSHAETKQSLKSGKTAVHGDQWPMFLYTGYHYDPDEPWKGLLRSEILIFIRFSLTSSSAFSRTDMIMDSENFYHSILDLLEDPDENEEVADLMTWWTRRVFPNSSSSQRCISKNSALSEIREKCAALRQLATADTN
ncbi:uncharacterized protein F5891DRAFT_1194588 [Suillus fuscotomentosus]|uniref:Uncharacterized protein n=1 Tax=Suillus fuscotomentosus TaxID=1912939 RepID=A0AAD4HFW3_9AGAM|nr:uncharacterized protein F5891DRAFT_1194588 [Suillus fuscotomentosus]KAG1895078.1 hypothetical protein F5891DRAFT_1194588 [Suillus fuscotomentosus]